MGLIINKYAFNPNHQSEIDAEHDEVVGGSTYYFAFPSIQEEFDKCDYIILYSYGNKEYANGPSLLRKFNDVRDYVFVHHNLIVSFVTYDYPQYGKSKGELNEQTIHESILKVFNHLSEKHVDKNIIVWGRSIGTIPTCYLANYLTKNDDNNIAHDHFKGVILESPLMTALTVCLPDSVIQSISQHHIPFDKFENITMVRETPDWGPTLIIHGKNDELISPLQSELLFKELNGMNALNKLVLIDEGTHNDLFTKNKSESITSVGNWLNELSVSYKKRHAPNLHSAS
jgi:fermentation-respiration switch protein FrsA (DUF1100 family)